MNLNVVKVLLCLPVFVLGQLRIDFDEAVGDTTFYRTVAEDFFRRAAAAEADVADSYAKGVSFLERSGFYEIIDTVRSTEEFSVLLTPTFVLSEIQIRGAAPLFESDIHSAFSLSVGDRVTAESIQEEVESLEEDLEDRFGLISPRVESRIVYDMNEGTADLELRISREGIYRIEDIRIAGNGRFTDRRLRTVSGLWRDRGGHLFVEEIEQKIRSIQEYYYSRQYPEAQVEWEYDFDEEAQQIILNITVDEGPRYDIDYSDVAPLRRRRVRTALDFSNQGNRNDFTLNRVLFNLRRELRSMGYQYGTVDFEDSLYTSSRGDSIREISLRVDTVEARTRLELIHFEGNEYFSERALKK
ncbi:POTRA domain-containing protein [Chitinivibrio alkaliphilus]|uniref:POTRA domain-containing protein n=1 Tax=Chitinivibrio alkaliphilus TaxID=1505232 RepID=UPI0012DEA92D|nr:POTRA domain-containing protein [Chitinivibrio alkaliphilus]